MPKNSIDHYNKSKAAEKANKARVRASQETNYTNLYKELIDPALAFYGDFPIEIHKVKEHTTTDDIRDAFTLSEAEKRAKDVYKKRVEETEKWNKLKLHEMSIFFQNHKAVYRALKTDLKKLKNENYRTTRDCDGIIIDEGILTGALLFYFKHIHSHEMPIPIAHKIALDMLYVFGYRDDILDNIIDNDYRASYFDYLAEIGILRIPGSYTETRYDGSEWNIYTWEFNKPAILALAQAYQEEQEMDMILSGLVEADMAKEVGLEAKVMAAST